MPENAFTRYLSTSTPQSEQENTLQVKNSAGGYTFTVNDKTRLERFLILGTDGGTYYIKERDLTKPNLVFLEGLIARNEELVWDTIKDISENGRAFRNSPAILALAYLFKFGKIKDTGAHYLDENGKVQVKPNFSYKDKTAKQLFRYVVRTSTHLYEFQSYCRMLRCSGRAVQSAIRAWYGSTGETHKGKNGWSRSHQINSTENLAYQAVKYRQRDGWAHRDLLRLHHPVGIDQNVGNFILKGNINAESPAIMSGFFNAQNVQNTQDLLNILDLFPNLPWEALPTRFLKDPEVWKKLFYNGQLKGQALVRSITRLARINAFNDMVFASDYAVRLVDEEMIRKTRLHPINYLNAVVVHREGQVARGNRHGLDAPYYGSKVRSKDWETNPVISDALNAGFHLAFKHVEPANKRTLIALDVSGSMADAALGIDLSCAQVGAAMAMTVARTEPYYQVYGFSDGTNLGSRGLSSFSNNFTKELLTDLGITPNMDLSQVMHKTKDQNFGRTDCALPMIHAARNNTQVDTFVIVTDNETWFGKIHPHKALEEYRQKTGIDAKLAVLGVAATDFTIADPRDRGMLDVVGFDSNVPKLVSEFSAGRV